MTKTCILASALLAAASFGTMSAANAVVPGSDTVERARDGAAIMSVIQGTTSAGRNTATESRATYGFPNTATTSSEGALVPGSRAVDDAADRDAVMSVINGTPGANYTATPGGAFAIVPGSDAF